MLRNSNGKTSVAISRDPDRTRRRILAAALTEFSAKGFSGARVDAIARRARGNKRMLYHYFGNKKALFAAVVRHKVSEHRQSSVNLPSDPAERLPFWFENACGDPEWVRLLEWEALQDGTERLIDEKERRAASADWLKRLRQRQKDGQLTPAFDPCHLAMAMQSLTLFPAAFPQLVRLNTGKSVDDPQFQSEYRKFLKQFAVAFRPRIRPPKQITRE